MDCYQEPRIVDSPSDCYFYHRTDVADLQTERSAWDIRHCVGKYLGNLKFSNQRVLDVGTASGYLSFEMERRGAEVVSFDMPSADSWDFVPHFQLSKDWEQDLERHRNGQRRLQNAYWYLHRQYQSKAKVHYGNIYQLPVELGNFDIGFMGMILGHLRDPFQAIYSVSRLCRSKIVITNQAEPKKTMVAKETKTTDRGVHALARKRTM